MVPFSVIGTVLNNHLCMNCLQRSVLVLILLLASLAMQATHIVGGEIFYRHLGGNNYEITLKVYRDCGPTNTLGTGFDQLARVGIFRDNLLYTMLEMDLFSAEVSIVPVTLDNPCFVLPPGVCVEEAIYTDTVVLPPHPSGYDIMHQRCCRNPSIINIQFPDDSGATFWTQIPGSNVVTSNSNPVFNSLPPVALCAGAEFVFDHSATDLDGDSLVYEFCTPLLGGSVNEPAPAPGPPPPYAPVVWVPGFNGGYQIASDPAFAINPQSGLMTGTATQPGQYVMGVCVSEYRNGVLLSTTNRDFQFNVTLCEPNVVVTVPEQESFCDGLTFSFSQSSQNADSFYWDFGDPTTDDDWSTEPNPEWTYADTGLYTVTLIANPGWTCADTVSVVYAAFPEINPLILQTDFDCTPDQTGLYDFEAGGSDFTDDAEYLWVFDFPGGPVVSSAQNPQNIEIPPDATFSVTLTVFDTGCESVVTEEFTPPPAPVAFFPAQETFCGGLTYSFENLSQNAESYLWDFGLPGAQATSTAVEPQYTYADTGIYTVTLTAMAPGTCPDQISQTLDIYWLLDAFYEPPDGQCFDGHSFDFIGQGTEESEAVYEWSFEGPSSVSDFMGQNVGNVTWDEPGVFDVTLTVMANGCVDSFTWPVDIIPDPTIDFSGGGEGCPPFLVHFDNNSFTATTATYLWEFGDGSSSSQANPIHTYDFPGTFDVILTMTTGGDCVQTLSMSIQDAVFSYPLPQAGLDIEPNTVNILNPEISITNLSEGNVTCFYNFGDGSTSTECDPVYSYLGSGYFDVIQTVTNEFGCTDTATGEVLVEGTLFYAPNAFTPDGDGVNDVWKPVLTGYTAYRLEVYNRWGELVFLSEDADEWWTGNVKGGDHFAQDGLYLYRCIIRDLAGLATEYEGHVILIR